MWLNPLKGDHLTLRQLDKTLPVDTETAATKADNMNIERGSFVYISTGGTANGTPKFSLYKADTATKANAVPYIVLTGVKDWQAGMAGNLGQAPIVDPSIASYGTPVVAGSAEAQFVGATQVADAQPFRGPRITAISVLQPAEWQTTAFAKKDAEGVDISPESYYVGCPLSIDDNGMLTPYTDGHNIVGYVTAKPFKRWINDLGASADNARISGGNAMVLNFSTAWIPVAAVADGEDKNVNILAKNKPTQAGAAANKPAQVGVAAGTQAGAAANKPAQAGQTK